MGVIEFWKGHKADVDLDELRHHAVPVKGKIYHDPGRCLEIFGNLGNPTNETDLATFYASDFLVEQSYLQLKSGIRIPFGEGIYQPPFVWQDCSPVILAKNLIYSTNAFFRIFSNLADQNLIPAAEVDSLLDQACLELSRMYKLQDSLVMKFINNNLNMYLTFMIVEHLVGKRIFDSECQEPLLTARSLDQTLGSIGTYATASVTQQMALALGRGVAFFEKFVGAKSPSHANQPIVEDRTYSYFDNSMAIDHRQHLIERVQTTNDQGITLSMCAIVDDTSETVFDLLWMQQLLENNRHFRINLLLNKAQVSINFSSNMLNKVLSNRHFHGLASRLNSQLFVFETFCPLMSFQTNALTQQAWRVIESSDFVYVKGLNFFETCQIARRDTYHAFVVYGPVSRLYTGLNEFDAVFAHVPKGAEGYVHNRNQARIVTLSDICFTESNVLRTKSNREKGRII